MSGVDDMCRLCLAVLQNDFCDILSPISYMADKINRYLYLTISEDDGLSKKICAYCFEKLNEMHFFAKTVAENQKTLLSLVCENKVDLSDELEGEEDQSLIVTPAVIYVKDTDLDKEDGEYDPDEMRKKKKKKRPGSRKKKIDWIYCPICKKQFRWLSKMDLHMRTHTGEKPFGCDLCGKRSGQKENIERHIREVHLGERPHKCTLCDKKLLDKTALRLHENIHKGLKPHRCEVCGNSFTQKANMLRHMMRRHNTDSMPYSCTFCPKKFTSKAELKLHVAKHTGMMPYLCLKCGEGFKSRAALKFHSEKHLVKFFPERMKIIEEGMPVRKKLKKKPAVNEDTNNEQTRGEHNIFDALMQLDACGLFHNKQ